MSLTVIKCGGAVAAQSAESILALADAGGQVCVVHGGGPQITAELLRQGIPMRWVGGRRATSELALAVVRESLAVVNAALCAELGPRALGLMGDEIGVEAEQIVELGRVGQPLPCAPAAVVEALAAGRIPVVAPLAHGPLNVNGDEVAAALAVGLGAAQVLFLTDVPGVLREGESLASIGVDEAESLLADGSFQGGIVPKLRAAITAVRLGLQVQIGETTVLP